MSIISEPLNRVSLLAKDHKGMRVDYSGLFRQARTALRHGAKEPALAEMLRQFQDHITELGSRWYAGDTSAVDELLQLYCVEKSARDALIAAPLTREAATVEELPPLPDPYEIDWPELHSQALGCGVEDRNIQDRYEAAEYGWQDGVDKAVERVPEEIFTADQMREYARAASAMGSQFAASDGLTGQAIGLLKRVRHVQTGESRQPEAVERDVKDFLALHGAARRVADDNGATRDMLNDARAELDQLRDALGVSYEPHQSLHERMLESARAIPHSPLDGLRRALRICDEKQFEFKSKDFHGDYLGALACFNAIQAEIDVAEIERIDRAADTVVVKAADTAR